jgi:hypothetical protein
MVCESFSCIPRKRKKYKSLKTLKNTEIANFCSVGTGDGVIFDEHWKVLKAIQLKDAVPTEDAAELRPSISVADKSVGSTELLELADKSTVTIVEESVDKCVGSMELLDSVDKSTATVCEDSRPETPANVEVLSSDPITIELGDVTDTLPREVSGTLDTGQPSMVIDDKLLIKEANASKDAGQFPTKPQELEQLAIKVPEPVQQVNTISTTDCSVQTDDILFPTESVASITLASPTAEVSEEVPSKDTNLLLTPESKKKLKLKVEIDDGAEEIGEKTTQKVVQETVSQLLTSPSPKKKVSFYSNFGRSWVHGP